MVETLFNADEIRDVKEVWSPIVEEPADREMRMARQLIEALEGTGNLPDTEIHTVSASWTFFEASPARPWPFRSPLVPEPST